MKKIKQQFLFLIYLFTTVSIFAQRNIPIVNTRPGAPVVFLLDYEAKRGPTGGESSGLRVLTLEDGSKTTVANATFVPKLLNKVTAEQVKTHVAVVSEFFSIFNVTITTDKNVYNNTPANRRIVSYILESSSLEFPATINGQKVTDFGGSRTIITNPETSSLSGIARGGVMSAGKANNLVYAKGETKNSFINQGAIICHEIGHNLGLDHHGTTDGNTFGLGNQETYFEGFDNYHVVMGINSTSSSFLLGMWSNGDYVTANNTTQDDLQVIQNNGLTLLADDYGNNTSSAKKINPISNTNYYSFKGIINSRTDKDLASLNWKGGRAQLKITLPNAHMLDPKITVLNANGQSVQSFNPDLRNNTTASYFLDLAAGNYFIEIDGLGRTTETVYNGNKLNYSDYGSLGQYEVSFGDPNSLPAIPVESEVIRIEAENNVFAQGVQTENTSDVGGGKNVTAIDTGDLIQYNVSLPKPGKYDIVFRVASLNQEIGFTLGEGRDILANETRASTGGAQKFENIVVKNVSIFGTDITLDLNPTTSGWNINWIEFRSEKIFNDRATFVPAKIEAENFFTMTGVKTENTIDAGGGKNVGFIDSGDSMQYKINVIEEGKYDLVFRVASRSAGVNFNLRSGTTNLGNITGPKTGDWQEFDDLVVKDKTLRKGEQILNIDVAKAGWNLNWIEIRKAGATPPVVNSGINIPGTIQPEVSDSKGGILKQVDITGSTAKALGFIQNNSFTTHKINVASTGTYKLDAYTTSAGAGGNIVVSVGSNNLATIAVPINNNWNDYTTSVSANISLTAGIQDIKFTYTGPNGFLFNIERIEFASVNTPAPPANTCTGGDITGLTTTGNTNTSVALSWSVLAGAKSYEIRTFAKGTYNGSVAGAAKYNTSNQASVNITGLTAGTEYTFAVRALCNVGNPSKLSSINASTSGGKTPNPPSTGGDIPINKAITISPVKASSVNNTFDNLSARFNEQGVIRPNAPNSGEWEKFIIENGTNGNIRIKVKNFGAGYRYLVVSGDNITATGTSASDAAAQFKWVTVNKVNKTFGLQSQSTGKWLQIPQNQNKNIAILNVKGGARGSWELFSYKEIPSAKNINSTNNGITILENPISNGIVRLNGTNNSTVYTIFNISGKNISTGNVREKTINVSSLEKGFYIIQTVNNGQFKTHKIIIK